MYPFGAHANTGAQCWDLLGPLNLWRTSEYPEQGVRPAQDIRWSARDSEARAGPSIVHQY